MNHNSRKNLIPLVLIVLLVIISIWYFVQLGKNGAAGDIQASGTVETVEIMIAPEISGRVVEVLVGEGDSVSAGDALFRLDDDLLQAQRRQAEGVLESAKAGLLVAETGLDSAKSSQSLAQASLDLAQTQYRLADEAARAADFKNREKSWREAVSYEFNLPPWYFDKAEQIKAAQVEVDTAKTALEKEQSDFQALVEKNGNQELIAAETRLANARATFKVLDEVLDRADAQNEEDCDNTQYARDHPDECENNEGSNDHVSDISFQNAEKVLEDVTQSTRDAARAELYAAQNDYDKLLGNAGNREIRQGRARLMMAIERYQLAQDYLNELYTGEDSLQIQSAQDAVNQAEATLKQAEVNVSQAEAKVEQANASIKQAQAEVDLIDVQLSKLEVKAAVNGVVMTRSIEPGEVVQAGAVALTLGELDNLTITVYVTEDLYGRVKLGDAAKVTADSFPGEKFDATVTRIANQAEFTPRNVQTDEGRRTTVFAIELTLENSDGKLKPGMPVDVNFNK
jgi:HlyD family secretion protein